MNKKDYKMLETAYHVSQLSDFSRARVGCVLRCKNKIISSGFNCNKTHPLQKIYNAERFSEDGIHSLHAETHALLPLLKKDIDWNNVSIYISRNRYDNGKLTFGMARPCKSCMALIKAVGIKKIFYTTNEGFCEEKMSIL